MRVDAAGENLVRRARAEDRSDAAVIVEVQGLGNLFHELVHVIRAGVLDDDHGIDYRQMPFCLDVAAHRALLWDEIAACVVSCAYATPTDPGDWFAEQIETQPVFYGMEADPGAFARAVDAMVHPGSEHARALEAVVEDAFARVEHWLREEGAALEQARPARRLRFPALWAEYRCSRADWFPVVAG